MKKYCVKSILLLTISPFLAIASDNVDDDVVKKWITTGSLSISCSGPASKEAILSLYITPEILLNNWTFLKSCRDSGMSKDLNLAAAEWYLFIRSAASHSGDKFYLQLPNWYSTLKSVTSAVGLSEILQSSSQPLSDTNKRVTEWGNLGVEHGLRDYKSRTGDNPTMKTDAFNTGFEFIKSKFY